MNRLTLLIILCLNAAIVKDSSAQLDTNSYHVEPSQIKTKEDLTLTPDIYINDVNVPAVSTRQKKKLPKHNYYNNSMLNVFFREEVGSIVHNSTDASANRWYATLGNEDELLSLGGTFGTHKDKTKKLTNLFSLGISIKSKDGFATIAKDGELVSGINGTVKYTWVGKGIVNNGRCDYGRKMEEYREMILCKKVGKDIDEYLKTGGKYDDWLAIENIDDCAESESLEKRKTDHFGEKYGEYYEKMAMDEVKIFQERKWYKFFWDHWITIDGSFPVSERRYALSTALTDTVTTEREYYSFKVSANYTMMWKFRNNMSVFLSGRGKFYNNNNIEMKELESESYRNVVVRSLTNVAITDEKDVFIGQFEQFLSGAFEAEAIWFFCKFAGISGSVEHTVGPRATFNWKVGMPLSLRDKDGKPTVNFELQYKEVNKVRLFGIRVGFIFGKYLG